MRRLVTTSDLDAVECADRLRGAVHRIQPLFAWKPLVGWATRDGFSVRSARRSLWPFLPYANGRLIPVSGAEVEIRIELGISVAYLVVAIVFAAIFLWETLAPGHFQPVLGAMFVFWVGWHALPLVRWRRRADRLVEILSSICGAVVQRG